MQQGVPVIDADLNDGQENIIANIRRAIEWGIGDGTPNSAYEVQESSGTNVNNFTLNGGDGTIEGAGRLFVKGFPALLVSDVDFTDNNAKIHPQITALTDTVLTDSSANYTVDELIGRELVPDITAPGTTITITDNTATTITVASGLVAATAVGNHYRVNLSTPGSNRTDKVYVNCFLDEIDSTEDTNLLHTGVPPSASNVEAARRLKLQTFIHVTEGGTTPANYTDGDGNYHAVMELASIDRLSGNNTITTAMITDSKPVSRIRTDILDGGSLVLSEAVELNIGAGLTVSVLGNRATIQTSAASNTDQSFVVEDFESISGITLPTEVNHLNYTALSYATAVEQGARTQFSVPFNVGGAGNVTIKALISMDSANAGDVVTDIVYRVNGGTETTDQQTHNVSDSADVFEVITLSSLTGLTALDGLSVLVKRRGDVAGDTHTGAMRLYMLIIQVEV